MSQLYKDLREGTDLLLDPNLTNADCVSISSVSSETVASGNRDTTTTAFFDTFKKLANKRRRNSEDSNSSPTISHARVEKSDSKSSSEGKGATAPASSNGSGSEKTSARSSAAESPLHRQNGTDEASPRREATAPPSGDGKTGEAIVVTAAASHNENNNHCRQQQSSESLNGSLKKLHPRNVGSPCQSLGSYTSLDSDTGLESCASSSRTDSWPSAAAKNHPNPVGGAAAAPKAELTRADAKEDDQLLSMEKLREEVEELRKLRDENHKELAHLRGEVRRLRGSSPMVKRRPGDVTATTKEHLV